MSERQLEIAVQALRELRRSGGYLYQKARVSRLQIIAISDVLRTENAMFLHRLWWQTSASSDSAPAPDRSAT